MATRKKSPPPQPMDLTRHISQQIRIRKEDAQRLQYISGLWGKPKTEIIRAALDALEAQEGSPTMSRREQALNLLKRQLQALPEGFRVCLYAKKDPAYPSELTYTVAPWDPNNPELPPWEIFPYPDFKVLMTKDDAWRVLQTNQLPWE